MCVNDCHFQCYACEATHHILGENDLSVRNLGLILITILKKDVYFFRVL